MIVLFFILFILSFFLFLLNKENMVITQPPLHEQVFPMTACDYKQHAKPFLRKVGPYTLTKTLGKGSTGKVKLAIDTETNKKVTFLLLLI